MQNKLKVLVILGLIMAILSQEPILKPWTIITTDEEGSSEFSISPGQYKKIKVVLIKNSNELFTNKKVELELDPKNPIKLIEGTNIIQINSLESNEYITYIGIDCSGILDKPTQLTWKVKNFADKIEVSTFTVKTKLEKPKISLELAAPIIPLNSYGLFKLSSDPLNMHQIGITISPNDSSAAYKIVLRKFSTDIKRKINDLKYISSNIEQEIQNNLAFEIDEQCFELSQTDFTFTVSNSVVPSIDFETKEILVNNLQIKTPTEDNAILISTKIPVAPVLLSCLTTTGKEFKDDEIRQQTKNTNEKNFYTQYYINKPKETFDILFENLNREGEYRLKCLLDNTANKDSESTEFIIGRFKKSDMMQPLKPSNKNSVPAECATWTF